jgi:NAD(P)-dependent dehydrogenase (short-subunit alcohol dehydrogenase family)
MATQLAGKRCVITGASRGLGQQVAFKLAAAGARVALIARSEKPLRETQAQIEAAGGAADIYCADVTDASRITSVREQVTAKTGAPHILVNAAGVFGPIQLVKDSDPERWVECIMANTIAPYLMCRAFLNDMIGNKWGRIINFSSAAALHPPGPLNSAYGVSKVALNQFTRHLAAELKGTGVTCNVMHPGDVKTDMWDDIRKKAESLGPIAAGYSKWVNWVNDTGGDDPTKAADLELKLCGPESGQINGEFLWIDNPLQAPIPSWAPPADERPWK